MAWYNSSWSHRATVTIDPTQVDEAVDWIYVPFSQFDATWWANVNSTDGRDIRVTQGDGVTELARYILPSFTDSGTSGTGGMFVDVSGYISASGAVDLHVYVGNAGASDYGPTDTYGRNNVFDANTVACYLPGETTTDLTGNGYDLTANNSPGTTASGYEGVTAATYDGTNQSHQTSSAPVTNWPCSILVLARTDDDAADDNICGLGDTSGGILRMWFAGTSSDKARALAIDDSSGTSFPISDSAFTANQWHQVVATSAANDHDIYLDDGVGGGATGASASASFTSFTIGGVQWGSLDEGDVDVAVAAVFDEKKSANWVSTYSNNFNSPSTFFVYGPTEDYQANCTQYVELTSAASAAGGGTITWTNISNALNSLADYAEATLASEGDVSYEVNLTNANGALSDVTGNTIVGIEVEVSATGEDHTARAVKDYDVQLIKGGSVSSIDKAEATAWIDGSIQYRTYGGPTDLWGLSWADTDITGSGFGVSLQFYSDDINPAIVRVYRVRVRVYYSASSGPGDDGFFLLFQ